MNRILLFLFLILCLNPNQTYSQDIPKFKVMGQCWGSLSLLVSPSTTKDQLKSLVYAFKEARQNNTLSQMIPPTTNGDIKGSYALIQIYIFDEPKWATEKNLKNIGDPNISSVYSDSDKNKRKKFVKQISQHVRAYYWANWIGQEIGSIGISTGAWGETMITPGYESLFRKE